MLDRTADIAPSGALQANLRDRRHLESYDEYYRAIAQLDQNTRVIECKDGIQWIVQRRAGDAWRGVSFCRTKEALLRGVREWVPGEHPVLAVLPDRFPEAAA